MASAAAERYLATFSPEDQQAIRAGGDVDAWYNAAVRAGAVPQNFGGTAPVANWANMTAEQAGINPWQQDYKQEFARTDAAALARMSPEQRARWSMEHLDALDYRTRQSSFDQWMAWQRHFDPSCPSSAPYQAEDGSGCVEKPDNSNAGYQQGQEAGGGGVQGGSGRGQNGQQNLTSPLVDMLRMQGSFLGGYDPTRGDNTPGIRGGVAGGGSIWWTPTGATTELPGTPAGAKTGGEIASGQTSPGGWFPGNNIPVRGGEIRNQTTGPAGPYGGIMGGYNLPRGGNVGSSVIARGGPIASPASGPAGPYGGIMGGQNVPRQDALTAAMTGLQGQQPFSGLSLGGTMADNTLFPRRRPAGLVGAISPFQRPAARRAGSWF